MRRVRAMKVLIAYYSRYGHILKMARAAGEGVKSAGVEAVLRRIEESPEIEKDIPKHKYAKAAWDEHKDTPVCKLDDLEAADVVSIGTFTRYGIDHTGQTINRFYGRTVDERRLGRQTSRFFYLYRNNLWRTGDYPVDDDGAIWAPRYVDCGGALFHARQALL